MSRDPANCPEFDAPNGVPLVQLGQGDFTQDIWGADARRLGRTTKNLLTFSQPTRSATAKYRHHVKPAAQSPKASRSAA